MPRCAGRTFVPNNRCRTFSRSPTVPGTSYADKPPPPPGSCRRTPAHLTAEPGRWPISARSETDRNGLFLRLGACLAAADELDDLVQSVGEFRKILLVEEYLVAVVTRCAVGGRDFAALGDGQEIVVAARGPDIEKNRSGGPPLRLWKESGLRNPRLRDGDGLGIAWVSFLGWFQLFQRTLVSTNIRKKK